MLKYLVEQYGTKLGNLIHYLRKLWADDPNARVIMFSQVHSHPPFLPFGILIVLLMFSISLQTSGISCDEKRH